MFQQKSLGAATQLGVMDETPAAGTVNRIARYSDISPLPAQLAAETPACACPLPEQAHPQVPVGCDPEIYHAWRTFEEYLRQGGYRVTLPRKLVLEHVFSRRDHFSADDAAAALQSGNNRVSRATVYTTLDLLVRAGLAHKLQDHHDRAHYEAARGELQHEHMICDTCGKFLEFSNRALLAIIAQECRSRGFYQRTQRIVVFGTCRECTNRRHHGRPSAAPA